MAWSSESTTRGVAHLRRSRTDLGAGPADLVVGGSPRVFLAGFGHGQDAVLLVIGVTGGERAGVGTGPSAARVDDGDLTAG